MQIGVDEHFEVSYPVQSAKQLNVPETNPCVAQVCEFNEVPSQISVDLEHLRFLPDLGQVILGHITAIHWQIWTKEHFAVLGQVERFDATRATAQKLSRPLREILLSFFAFF